MKLRERWFTWRGSRDGKSHGVFVASNCEQPRSGTRRALGTATLCPAPGRVM